MTGYYPAAVFSAGHTLLFASDAKLAVLAGAMMLGLALLALTMDRKRLKRERIEQVGWVPWTGIFLILAIIGAGLLAMSLPVILAG